MVSSTRTCSTTDARMASSIPSTFSLVSFVIVMTLHISYYGISGRYSCNAFTGIKISTTTRTRMTRTTSRRQRSSSLSSPSPPPPSLSSSICLHATQYDRCDVAVLGGGFGGLYTALSLARQANNNNAQKNSNNKHGRSNKPLDIVLVDPSDRFVFLPLLYDLTMGTATEREVCPMYEELLEGTGIRHVKASFDRFITSPQNVSSFINDDDNDEEDDIDQVEVEDTTGGQYVLYMYAPNKYYVACVIENTTDKMVLRCTRTYAV